MNAPRNPSSSWNSRKERSPRRPRPSILAVESLEGRALLSGAGAAMSTHGAVRAAAIVARPAGTAHKTPAFYEFYTGPKRADLDVVSASARLVPGRRLVLFGEMKGKIDVKPASEDQQSYYVFGINRHSSSAVTPFFQRPGITFDAVVVVSVEQEGITASVTDLVTKVKTDIDPSAVHVAGRQVRVRIDPSLLPTPDGGVDLANASFNLWPRSSLDNTPQPNHGSTVASFVPENATQPIGVFPRAKA